MEKRGRGRPAGALNKGNEKLRKALARFVERNHELLGDTMEQIRAESPKDWVNLFIKLTEFSLPKLQAVQQTVEYSDETISKINIEIVNRNQPTGSV